LKFKYMYSARKKSSPTCLQRKVMPVLQRLRYYFNFLEECNSKKRRETAMSAESLMKDSDSSML
jgi:hypothetical protein